MLRVGRDVTSAAEKITDPGRVKAQAGSRGWIGRPAGVLAR